MNNFFGNIIKAEWISGIESNETEVHVAKEHHELDSLIETFKLRFREESNDNDNVNNYFGQNKKLDRLIIMDDVSGVADTSKKIYILFGSFKEV